MLHEILKLLKRYPLSASYAQVSIADQAPGTNFHHSNYCFVHSIVTWWFLMLVWTSRCSAAPQFGSAKRFLPDTQQIELFPTPSAESYPSVVCYACRWWRTGLLVQSTFCLPNLMFVRFQMLSCLILWLSIFCHHVLHDGGKLLISQNNHWQEGMTRTSQGYLICDVPFFTPLVHPRSNYTTHHLLLLDPAE